MMCNYFVKMHLFSWLAICMILQPFFNANNVLLFKKNILCNWHLVNKQRYAFCLKLFQCYQLFLSKLKSQKFPKMNICLEWLNLQSNFVYINNSLKNWAFYTFFVRSHTYPLMKRIAKTSHEEKMPFSNLPSMST